MRKPKIGERIRMDGKIFLDGLPKTGVVTLQLGSSRFKVIRDDTKELICVSIPYINKIYGTPPKDDR